MSDILWTC